MTDHVADTQTTPDPAAAAAPDASQAAAAADFSTHPVWGQALATVPDVLRGPGTPLYEAIQTSEREAQRAIEAARGTDVPKEWRELAAEAQQMGVTVDELAAAYQGQQSLAQLLQSDPDAFVSELQGQVDALVAAGQLTRREGAQVMQQANQAADAAGGGEQLFQSDTERQLAELKAWKEQQEQREEAAARRQREEQAAAQAQQEEEAASNAYFDAFDREMEAAGIMVRGQDGRLVSAIPVPTLQLIASTGAQLRDANPQLPYDQAVKQAFTHVKGIIEATGGRLAPAQQAGPTVPVIGASSSVPTGQVQQPTGPRSMADRMAAALAEAERQAGQG